MEHLTPPPSEVVTDLEFIFLGGTKLVHTLREADTYEDRGHEIYLRWADTGEDATLPKASLLQLGRRVRLVSKVDQSAVAKIVQEIKQKEAQAQGATSRSPTAPAAAGSTPSTSAVSPEDLWSRSPLTR